jgi:hypothetical protein
MNYVFSVPEAPYQEDIRFSYNFLDCVYASFNKGKVSKVSNKKFPYFNKCYDGKLRTYVKFKTVYGRENYLSLMFLLNSELL